MPANKVKDSQTFLPFLKTEATAELLKEDGETLGWPEEENGIDFWDINAFIVEINDEDEVNLPGF